MAYCNCFTRPIVMESRGPHRLRSAAVLIGWSRLRAGAILVAWAIAVSIPVMPLDAQINASLSTEQTAVNVQAGDETPRVIDLRSGNGAAWNNAASESL